jgi:hypothetical protein
MKYYNTFIFILFLTGTSMHGQFTEIPDIKFEEKLVELGLDVIMDGRVSNSNIASVGVLNVSNSEISDLTGIEGFTNLTRLNCDDNELEHLDFTDNSDLERLFCDNNSLISIDVTSNTALEHLYCSTNQLTSIDVTNNISLKNFVFFGNQLTTIDISNNTVLKYLSADYNELESLDVSQNIILQDLLCNYNNITNLDISNNTGLQYLDCSENQLTTLDITANSFLQNLFCKNNKLITLNLKNGANEILTNFNGSYNSTLDCIQVDNVASSNIKSNWVKDAIASYSTFCSTAGITTRSLLNNISLLRSKNKKIEIKTPLKVDFKIFTINGQEIVEGNSKENNGLIYLDGFSEGLYILRIMYKNVQISKKFILN